MTRKLSAPEQRYSTRVSSARPCPAPGWGEGNRHYHVSVLVVGCGNLMRGDDGVGIVAVRQLQEQLSRHRRRNHWPNLQLKTAEIPAAGLALLELLEGVEIAVIVDAVRAGTAPGTILRIDGWDLATAFALGQKGRKEFAPLTCHDFDFATTLALGATLLPERMPRLVRIWGVEPDSLHFGEALSAPVASAVPVLVSHITDYLRRIAKGT